MTANRVEDADTLRRGRREIVCRQHSRSVGIPAATCYGPAFAPARIANRWLLLAMKSVSPTAIGVE
jgi:hypothetical protein